MTYLYIFLILAGVTLLPLIILCALRAIALCKLREGKYEEMNDEKTND